MYNVLAAFMFFTRLPFWRIKVLDKEYFKNVVNYWPYAGIITGGLGALVMLASSYVFPVIIAVTLGVLTRVLITGALHEDGLADFFDGFGGGTSKEKILSIMKDSHIGSYGVIALIFYFTIIVGVLASFPVPMAATLFLCGDILCKFIASNIVNVLPYARAEEESKNKLIYNFIPDNIIAVNLLFVTLLFGVCYKAVLPVSLSYAVFVPIFVFVALVSYIKRKIGGYTGDCCGAVFLICEISFYIASLALVRGYLYLML